MFLELIWLFRLRLGHVMPDFSKCVTLPLTFCGPSKFLRSPLSTLTIFLFYRMVAGVDTSRSPINYFLPSKLSSRLSDQLEPMLSHFEQQEKVLYNLLFIFVLSNWLNVLLFPISWWRKCLFVIG
jgi:hypothetical protein